MRDANVLLQLAQTAHCQLVLLCNLLLTSKKLHHQPSSRALEVFQIAMFLQECSVSSLNHLQISDALKFWGMKDRWARLDLALCPDFGNRFS